jgi:N-glycosylase/DNA lyase
MTVDIINQTIRAMCLEVETQALAVQNWQLMAEEEFLYEAAICIFGSQMVFEMAVATADRLREKKLLQPAPRGRSIQAIERKVVEALCDPLPVPACDVILLRNSGHLC